MDKKINKFYLIKYILKLIIGIALLPGIIPLSIIGFILFSVVAFIMSSTFNDFVQDIKDLNSMFFTKIFEVLYYPDMDSLYN